MYKMHNYANQDDEFHYFLKCKINNKKKKTREIFLEHLKETHNNCNTIEKIITVLNAINHEMIKQWGIVESGVKQHKPKKS